MVGITLIIIAFIIGLIRGLFKRVPNKQKTDGTIVNTKSQGMSSNGRLLFSAEIEYFVSGKRYIVKSGYHSSSFRTGNKIKIMFDKDFPEKGFICPDLMSYFIFWGLIVAAIVIEIFLAFT